MAGYLIAEIADVRDEKAYAEYRTKVSYGLVAAGGRYLARGGPIEVLEGRWRPGRIVLVRFESMDEARAWWSSSDYEELKRLRQRSVTTNMIVVEGLPGAE